MKKTTDYRSKHQKRMDKKRAKVYARYLELRRDGLSKTKACEVAAEKEGWTPPGVWGLVKRIDAQQNN